MSGALAIFPLLGVVGVILFVANKEVRSHKKILVIFVCAFVAWLIFLNKPNFVGESLIGKVAGAILLIFAIYGLVFGGIFLFGQNSQITDRKSMPKEQMQNLHNQVIKPMQQSQVSQKKIRPLCYTLARIEDVCIMCSKINKIPIFHNINVSCNECGYTWYHDDKGRSIHTGRKGGKFFFNENGKKIYL